MSFKMHHISLSVTDVARSLAFYRDGLGLKQKAAWRMGDKPAAMLLLEDGAIIEIFENGTDAPVQNARWGHLALYTEDVDAAYARALALGAVSKTPPTDALIASEPPMPIRIAFVYGPDGEEIEFFKNI